MAGVRCVGVGVGVRAEVNGRARRGREMVAGPEHELLPHSSRKTVGDVETRRRMEDPGYMREAACMRYVYVAYMGYVGRYCRFWS